MLRCLHQHHERTSLLKRINFFNLLLSLRVSFTLKYTGKTTLLELTSMCKARLFSTAVSATAVLIQSVGGEQSADFRYTTPPSRKHASSTHPHFLLTDTLLPSREGVHQGWNQGQSDVPPKSKLNQGWSDPSPPNQSWYQVQRNTPSPPHPKSQGQNDIRRCTPFSPTK